MTRDPTYFFFQAEDGIRDRTVTGVQTCALPISCTAGRLRARLPAVHGGHRAVPSAAGAERSEERRVGKECRDTWSQEQYKKTRQDFLNMSSSTTLRYIFTAMPPLLNYLVSTLS